MKLIYLKNFIRKYIIKNSNKGFTFLEFILAITLLGITSSIAIPLFKNGINKSKQKEASLIVSSMIKGAKSKYGISANLPENMGDLSKFSNFEKCDAYEVETQGDLVCKNAKPIKVGQLDTTFFSPSGNYKIDLKTENIDNQGEMFLVKANPNGMNFSREGSSVIGCYSPISGVTIIKEYSARISERGEKPYITCGLKIDIARGPPKPGCTNPKALNYNKEATIDDGSCIFKCPPEEICGCTNPDAINYNPEATVDDGSCIFPIKGCTDPEAINYNPKATEDDGSCIYKCPPGEICGCTNPDAINYNPEATVDDGSCIFKCPPDEICGCTNPDAINYNPEATVDDGSCIIDNPSNDEKNSKEKKLSKTNKKSSRLENNNIKNQNTSNKGFEVTEKINIKIKIQQEESSVLKTNKTNSIDKFTEEKEKVDSPIPPWIR